MDEKALTVTQFNTFIKQILDSEEFLSGIKVYGEISGFSITRGVAYFYLKDENATLSCVMFGADSKCDGIKDGDMVVAVGSPNYYVKAGKFNFNCVCIRPYGVGKLFNNFLLMKEKLEKEGLFDVSHKKEIPKNVKTIGVVTSETGAVFHDIINVSTRRDPSINLILYPSKVQGVDAELDIVKGINFFSSYDGIDVIIVCRGGGSLEDLQPFNTEIVARAVYNCKKPIVSAVGHETDFSICDFASDLRAPTPSAAAELVVENKILKIETFNMLLDRFNLSLYDFLNPYYLKIESLEKNMNLLGENVKARYSVNLKFLLSKFENLCAHFFDERLFNLNLQNNMLYKLNPNILMNMGYAKVEKLGKCVSSITDIDSGEKFTVRLKDGRILATCENKEGL